MKRNNGNGVLVGIFIGIIVMILVFIGLFMTNTISFSSKSDNNSNTSSGDDNLNSGNDITYLLPDKDYSRWYGNRASARANREIPGTSQRVQRCLLADGRWKEQMARDSRRIRQIKHK